MLKQFVQVSWHLGGMTYDRFLALSLYERFALLDELDDMIGRVNEANEVPPSG